MRKSKWVACIGFERSCFQGGEGGQYNFRDVEGVTVGGGGHHLRVWLLDQNIEPPGLAGERTQWKPQQGHNRVVS